MQISFSELLLIVKYFSIIKFHILHRENQFNILIYTLI